MTVPGENSAVPVSAHESPDELFTRVYNRSRESLVRHIYFRLDLRHADMAEDLAQEVFIRFWNRFVKTGCLKDPDNENMVYALLKKMAQGPIGDFYELCSTQRDRSLDFADPANTPIIANGHAYALDAPELRVLVDGIEAAMDHMVACSEKWRSLHKERHVLRGQLADDYLASRGGLTADAKARIADRLKDADTEEIAALETFRKACANVGQLRADIEAEAGVNWKSAVGMPVAPESTAFRKGVYRNDRSVTHCPEGHLLEKDNVNFGKDGSRRCRACDAAVTARFTAKRRTGRTVPGTVTDDAIAKGRAMFADPATAHMTVQQIATAVGCSAATLSRRVPDHKALRASALTPAAAAR